MPGNARGGQRRSERNDPTLLPKAIGPSVKQTGRRRVSRARQGTISPVNRRNLIALGSAAALLVAFFAWEWYLSPEARVERSLRRAAAAAEEKDVEGLLSCLSRDYSDFRNLDFDSLSEMLERGFERVDRLNVTLRAVRAEVEGAEATASFDLTVVAIQGDQRFIVVGTLIEPQKLRVDLRREEGEWKILRVRRAEEKNQTG